MNSPHPRLLFLAHYFPPVNVVACVRSWNMATHLSRRGWDVRVVTPHPSVWRKVEHPKQVEKDLDRHGIRRLDTGQRWRGLMPELYDTPNEGISWVVSGLGRAAARNLRVEMQSGWIAPVRKATASLRSGEIDLILATGPPFIAFDAAYRLSRRLGCPFVLDYRDPWTSGNHHRTKPIRLHEVRREERMLAESGAVLTVSEGCAETIGRRMADPRKLHILPNGYDHGLMESVSATEFDHFAIVYAGQFYPPKRDIAPLMAALKSLDQQNQPRKDWRFHYYGPHGAMVTEAARQSGLTGRTIIHGQVSREEALSATKGAGVAVVITSVEPVVTPESRGVVTGKVYEALGFGTPILVIAPPGSDVDGLVGAAGSGRRFSGHEHDGMARYLLQLMDGPSISLAPPEAYSWEVLAERLDGILREACLGVVATRAAVVESDGLRV